jgi:hypothetical protein
VIRTHLYPPVFAFIALFFNGELNCAAQSVLSSGTWHKLSVDKPGIYKISRDLFKKMGFNPASTDPRKIRIYGNEGGMLPQENDAARPQDLQELAIRIEGEGDGAFDKDDFILFYAEGPDRISYDQTRQIFQYENNLYSDENFYFITVTESQGKRIQPAQTLSGGEKIDQYVDYFFHELEEHNELHSGRDWFGEKLDGSTDVTFNIPLRDIVAGSEIKIASQVMGQSYLATSFKLLLNDVVVGQHPVSSIPSGVYSNKGDKKRDTFLIAESSVAAAQRTEQQLRYQFVKSGSFSQGYLDWFLMTCVRQLKLISNQAIFTAPQSLQQEVSQYEVGVSTDKFEIWNITNVSAPESVSATFNNGVATFSASSTELHNYIIFNDQPFVPKLAGAVVNQNLHGLTTPNLLIVSHNLFYDEALRLAQHRSSYSGWTVHVVTTDQVFNEFSSGRQDISAIRDFTKYLYDQSPSVMKGILLFGRGSYDYKNRVNDNTNFVPTYQSRNSLHPLQTYASDDYFGFLEDTEGKWSESPVVNHSLDIGVGRLPVTTVEDASNVVDKIIEYEEKKSTHSPWRKKIVFVADDGNSEDGFNSLHQEQADAIATQIEQAVDGIDTKKLFMGTYDKILKPNGESVPQMEDDLVRAFNDGVLVINFTGHGSEKLWTDERILSEAVITELENDIYPFLITATCEFGRNDDPFQTSSAELSVLQKQGGAIGIVTTTRPVNAFPNFSLNQAFYQALFMRDGNQFNTLGEVFLNTKNGSFSGVSNRNFMLLADPSMTLALPPNKVIPTSIKTVNGSDTLKALSTVVLKAEITNASDEKLTAYNGIGEVVIFDKQTDFRTIGRNDPAFEYTSWHNVLFRGKTTIKNGDLEMQFMLPKNISYTIGEAKLSIYASADDANDHAMGSTINLKIGGTEDDFDPDSQPPAIQAFIGDTTFINGGITKPDTDLIVKLSDNSGINISEYGLGNSLIAVLDNDIQTFVLNDYYVANTDDYTSGVANFPLRNLEPGRHTMTIKAWDIYNNPSKATINFIVTDGEQIQIEEFGNFPNPVTDKTTLYFKHNSSGDDLEAQVFIYSLTGHRLFDQKIELLNSPYQADLLVIDNTEKKLPAGLYVVRMVVRSLTNGSKNEQVTKLIILN